MVPIVLQQHSFLFALHISTNTLTMRTNIHTHTRSPNALDLTACGLTTTQVQLSSVAVVGSGESSSRVCSSPLCTPLLALYITPLPVKFVRNIIHKELSTNKSNNFTHCSLSSVYDNQLAGRCSSRESRLLPDMVSL